jgi:hypothetical protein
MLGRADLDELNAPLEEFDHFLVSGRLPPFDCEVFLASGANNPKGQIASQ